MIAHRFQHRPGTLLLTLIVFSLLTTVQALATDSNTHSPIGLAIGHLDFGTVVVGESVTLPDRISNNTTSAVTIDSIQGLGTAFEVTGINVPMVLNAGQSAAFGVRFQPKRHDDHVTTIAFNTQDSQSATLIASGQAVYREKLTANPSPVMFANVQVGSNQTQTVTLTNEGLRQLTINQSTLSGAGFSMSNLALPLTLTAGQTTSFTVTFAPTRAGYFSGQIALATVTNDHAALSANLVIALFGSTGSGAGIVFSPSSLAFGSIQVGSSSNQTETLTNLGGSSVTISQATVSGAGFSLKKLALPMTLGAGQSVPVTVVYSPTANGAVSGSLNITSNDTTNPNLSIPLSGTGTGTSGGSLNASPSNPNFGNVTVGSTQSMGMTVTNTGGGAVTLSNAVATGSGFKFTGQNPPITLNAGQSATFNVSFTPPSAGAASGALTISSDASNSTLAVPLSGMGVGQGQLGLSPSSLAFGNIQVGTSKSLNASLTNSGGTSLTISGATASGAGFSLSGLTLPLTLNAGQSASFTVAYAPTVSGAASGNVSITSSASNSSLSIPLSGSGVTQGSLTANPASLAFGSVPVSGSTTLPETLTNTGGSPLTISAASASGSGFSLSGLTLPMTLNAGQSASFTVAFSPTVSGSVSGNVNITSNGSNPNLSIALSGSGAAAGSLTSNPTSLAFGSIQVSGSKNLSETVTNTSGSSVTISQASASGSGFSIGGLTLPLTLAANQSVTFTATFAPTGAGAASGTLSVVSNASNSPLNIALSGTGTATGQLAVTPTSLSFGSVTVGASSSLNGTLTASGASVTVNSAGLDNGEFELFGLSLPVTIAAGQSASFSVTFTPQASGAVSANLSFSSNATNSSTVQTMTGTGAAAVQHSVSLTWKASSDAVGYNVYRGTSSGGPYTMINSTLDGTTSYSDTTVASGQTYYYVATAVDNNSNESAYSTQTKAVVPNP